MKCAQTLVLYSSLVLHHTMPQIGFVFVMILKFKTEFITIMISVDIQKHEKKIYFSLIFDKILSKAKLTLFPPLTSKAYI